MFYIIFTSPNKFTKSYKEACEIADAHYESTGEIVAVEQVSNRPRVSDYAGNLRTRQELIGNNLMEVIDDYPDQIRPIIDELVSYLNDSQLDQIEDLIVNNYEEDS